MYSENLIRKHKNINNINECIYEQYNNCIVQIFTQTGKFTGAISEKKNLCI